MNWRVVTAVAWVGLMLCVSLLWMSNPCAFYGPSAELAMGLMPPALAAAGALYVLVVVRRRVLVSALLGLATVGYVAVIQDHLPFKLRWRVSRAYFEAWTHRGDLASRQPGRLGLFWGVTVQEPRAERGVRFELSQHGECAACSICIGCGVVRLSPSSERDAGLEPLGDDWYWFRECS